MNKMPDRELHAEWVAALESGEYEQGAGCLRTENDEFCCLGVLCVLLEKRGIVRWEGGGDYNYVSSFSREKLGLPGHLRIRGSTSIPGGVGEALGISASERYRLASMNDGVGEPRKTFPEIAQYIRENL